MTFFNLGHSVQLHFTIGLKINFKDKKIYFINGDTDYFSVRNAHKMHTLFSNKDIKM